MAVLRDNPSGLYALDIMKRTRLGPGRLYPLLAALERDGVVTAAWSVGGGRGRRMFYQAVTR